MECDGSNLRRLTDREGMDRLPTCPPLPRHDRTKHHPEPESGLLRRLQTLQK